MSEKAKLFNLIALWTALTTTLVRVAEWAINRYVVPFDPALAEIVAFGVVGVAQAFAYYKRTR